MTLVVCDFIYGSRSGRSAESNFFRRVNTQGCVCSGVGKTYFSECENARIQFHRRYGKKLVEKKIIINAEDIRPRDFTPPHLISSRHNLQYHPTFRFNSFKEIPYHCLLKMNDSYIISFPNYLLLQLYFKVSLTQR